jgi:predicted metal-dependent phosphoesterase TrpH
MLKVDLHIHTDEDPKHPDLGYGPKQLIDRAAELGYDVLALTYHDAIGRIGSWDAYAQKKGILLLSGVERNIEGKHVLVYNLSEKESQALHNFEDLAILKKKNKQLFVIAPHPFHFTDCCLGGKMKQHFSLFDAAELSWFYSKPINPNRRLLRFLSKYPLPLVATSDLHRLGFFGRSYTLIDAPKDKSRIFAAIRAGNIKVVSRPVSTFRFLSIALHIFLERMHQKIF